MLLDNLSATLAAHYTTWRAYSLPMAEPTPGPNTPNIFDGEASTEIDDATSNIIANVLLVLGAIAFAGFVGALLAHALTKKSFTKAMVFTAIATVATLGPAGVLKFLNGSISGIF